MPDLSRLSDHDLLRFADEDGRRFAEFYRRHVSAVLAALAQMDIDPWTAADATAETFAAAALHRRRFDPRRGSGRAWILGIARKKAIDQLRRRRRDDRLCARLRLEPIDLTETDLADYEALRSSSGPAVSALSELTPLQRAAVHARVVEGRPYSVIAEGLGLSEVAIRQHVSRGLAYLRRTLRGRET